MKTSRPPTQVQLLRDGQQARIVFSGTKGIQTLSLQTRQQLRSILEPLRDDDSLRCLTFTGTGRTFIAGAEISELAALDEHSAEAIAIEGQQLMTLITQLPQVTIAAINGACVGGGLELALACDLRLAIDSAQIGFPETRLGILPCWGGTTRMLALFGRAVASQFILSGELHSATFAQQIGVITKTVDANDFEHCLNNMIEQQFQASPISQRFVKELFDLQNLSDFFDTEAVNFGDCYRNGIAQAGLKAYLEKRPPDWVPLSK